MTDEAKVFVCHSCGVVLGQLVEVRGQVYLNDGSWLIRIGRRYCHICGSLVDFRPPKKELRALNGSVRSLEDVFNTVG